MLVAFPQRPTITYLDLLSCMQQCAPQTGRKGFSLHSIYHTSIFALAQIKGNSGFFKAPKWKVSIWAGFFKYCLEVLRPIIKFSATWLTAIDIIGRSSSLIGQSRINWPMIIRFTDRWSVIGLADQADYRLTTNATLDHLVVSWLLWISLYIDIQHCRRHHHKVWEVLAQRHLSILQVFRHTDKDPLWGHGSRSAGPGEAHHGHPDRTQVCSFFAQFWDLHVFNVLDGF